MMTPPNEASQTLYAYERIRSDLLTGKLRPGGRLKINDLCKQLDINLSAVREALSRLSSDGLVIALPQRGFRVAPVSQAELFDLTATRIEIEQSCYRQAVDNPSIAWETELVAAGHRLFRTPKHNAEGRLSDEWFKAHKEFHRALAAGCQSPWRLRLHDQLYVQAERYQRLSAAADGGTARDIDAEHRDLMDAMLARDGGKASALIATHLGTTATMLGSASWEDEEEEAGAA
jgi:DNA-binding GntR family transcriptional regulator